MAVNFHKNLQFLREEKGENQEETASALGLTRSTYANYETGANLPKADVLLKIIGHFGTAFETLMSVDIKNAHLNKKSDKEIIDENAHLIAHPNAHLIAKNDAKPGEVKLVISADPDLKYGKKHMAIPITDISVAAGAGILNNDYVEHTDHLSFPVRMTKKGSLHLAIRVKGASMAPTLHDGSYVIVRLMDRAEWAEMPDRSVFVVCDMEGKGYIKRVKNRFKKDFIVLMSDNPDKVSYSNFNLHTNEIHHIWEAVAKVDFKLPNIHDQYYSRLEELDDRLSLLEERLLRNGS